MKKTNRNVKILAIETAADACSAALFIDNEIIERYEVAPQQHTKLILPMVQSLLAEAGIKLTQLDAIGFGQGPGSFTGLRIAASVTQGLALGADLPVIGISTLRALAQGAVTDFKATKALSIIDARIQEIYFGMYSLVGGIMNKIMEDTLCNPKDVPIPDNCGWFGIGNGWKIYFDILNDALKNNVVEINFDYYPRAREVAKLAYHEFLDGNITPVEKASPVYLRNKVVG